MTGTAFQSYCNLALQRCPVECVFDTETNVCKAINTTNDEINTEREKICKDQTPQKICNLHQWEEKGCKIGKDSTTCIPTHDSLTQLDIQNAFCKGFTLELPHGSRKDDQYLKKRCEKSGPCHFKGGDCIANQYLMYEDACEGLYTDYKDRFLKWREDFSPEEQDAGMTSEQFAGNLCNKAVDNNGHGCRMNGRCVRTDNELTEWNGFINGICNARNSQMELYTEMVGSRQKDCEDLKMHGEHLCTWTDNGCIGAAYRKAYPNYVPKEPSAAPTDDATDNKKNLKKTSSATQDILSISTLFLGLTGFFYV